MRPEPHESLRECCAVWIRRVRRNASPRCGSINTLRRRGMNRAPPIESALPRGRPPRRGGAGADGARTVRFCRGAPFAPFGALVHQGALREGGPFRCSAPLCTKGTYWSRQIAPAQRRAPGPATGTRHHRCIRHHHAIEPQLLPQQRPAQWRRHRRRAE